MILINKDTFSALKHKDFKYFMIGQSISLIGTWMQKTAQVWLLYSLTKSPFLLGILGIFQFGPMLLFGVFSGVIIDRLPKKKLLYITQSVNMFQAFILTILVYSECINYWEIFILAIISGLAQTLDMPTRQSFFIELVGKDDLPNAISLNSTITNIAKILGPSISGVIMLKFGIKFCFLINFLSFIAVLMGLFLISAEGKPAYVNKKNFFGEVKEGLIYIKSHKNLLSTICVMAITCTFAMNIDVIAPVFSKTVLGKGADGYTFILSSMGVGSLIGAIKMASRKREGLTLKFLKYNAFLTGILQVAASFSHNLFICSIFVMGAGFANMVFLNCSNSRLQLNTSNEYRGRVMSIYSLLNQGTTPVGNLFVGTAMNKFGSTSGFFLCGLVTVVLTIAFCSIYPEKRSSFNIKEIYR